MFKFADTKQNNWTLSLTIGGVIKVQKELGINLLDPMEHGDDGIPLSAKTLIDDVFLANVVTCLIDTQLTKNNVTKEEFLDGLDATSMKDMSDAFSKEYQAFFMSRGRSGLADLLRKEAEAVQQAFDTVTEQSTSLSDEVDSDSKRQVD